MQNKPDNLNQNEMANKVLTGVGMLAGAALLGVLSKNAADAYNTKRKYDSIDKGIDNLFGSIPVIGGLFK